MRMILIGVACLLTGLTASNARADLNLSPSTGLCSAISPACLLKTGDQTSTSAILSYLSGLGYDVSTELYKQNVGDVFDTGAFAGSYTTVFSNTASDPSNATITWNGSPNPFITGSPLY